MKGKISRQEVKLKALRHNPGSGDELPSTEREVGENVGEQSAARFSMTRWLDGEQRRKENKIIMKLYVWVVDSNLSR